MKRKVSVLLVAVFLLSSMVITVHAADASVNSVSAKRGDTVTFNAVLSGSETVGMGGVELSYDSNVLELVSGTCEVSGAMLTNFDLNTGLGAFMFAGTGTVSGTLFTATFRVKDDAPIGTTPVSMDISLIDGSNVEMPVSNSSGSITVKAGGPTASVNSVSAKRGDTVTFNAVLSGSETVGMGGVELSYDSSVLELVGGTCEVSGAMLTNFDLNTGLGAFMFAGTGTVGGTLFTATFKVKDDAPIGTTPVSMDISLIDGSNVEMPVSNSSGSITVESAVPSVGETVTGYNLTLQGGGSGDIGVNLGIKMTEELKVDVDAYISIQKNGVTQKVPVSELVFDANGKALVTSYVSAKNMGDVITVTVFNGKGESGASYSYSVKEYAEYILENSGNYDPHLVYLVKAMLNYGSAAQKHFDYNVSELANESLSAADKAAVDNCTEVGTAADRNVVKTGNKEAVGLASHTTTLLLGAQTTIRHYVSLAQGININDLTFKIGDNALVPEKDGDRYAIDVIGIPASEFDKRYVLTVTDGTNVYSAEYSVLNYLGRMYDSSKDNSELASYTYLLKSMYLYNVAAESYFN